MRKSKPASHSSEKPVLGARNRGILEPFAGGNSAFVGNAVFLPNPKHFPLASKESVLHLRRKQYLYES